MYTNTVGGHHQGHTIAYTSFTLKERQRVFLLQLTIGWPKLFVEGVAYARLVLSSIEKDVPR
jgi:hypothetical protein